MAATRAHRATNVRRLEKSAPSPTVRGAPRSADAEEAIYRVGDSKSKERTRAVSDTTLSEGIGSTQCHSPRNTDEVATATDIARPVETHHREGE